MSDPDFYQFVAPGPGDARGECPGLNAMANHGYLPHNGIATIEQFINGTYEVFGMAPVYIESIFSGRGDILTAGRILLDSLRYSVLPSMVLSLGGPSRDSLTLELPDLTTTTRPTALPSSLT